MWVSFGSQTKLRHTSNLHKQCLQQKSQCNEPKTKEIYRERAQAQNEFTNKAQNIHNLHKQGPDPTESLKSPWGTTFRRYQKTQVWEIPVAQGSVTQGSRGHKTSEKQKKQTNKHVWGTPEAQISVTQGPRASTTLET